MSQLPAEQSVIWFIRPDGSSHPQKRRRTILDTFNGRAGLWPFGATIVTARISRRGNKPAQSQDDAKSRTFYPGKAVSQKPNRCSRQRARVPWRAKQPIEAVPAHPHRCALKSVRHWVPTTLFWEHPKFVPGLLNGPPSFIGRICSRAGFLSCCDVAPDIGDPKGRTMPFRPLKERILLHGICKEGGPGREINFQGGMYASW